MNSNMAAGVGEREASWLDFYALLGVSPQADSTTIRKRIGEAYSEATANIDHRDLNRRHYFQTMVEQVLPQCRRVLLDPTMRSRYDEENARHAASEPGALDYVSFMANLQGASAGSAGSAGSARQALARAGSEFDLLPERVRDEINLAQAVIQAVQSGSEFDLLPARALSPNSQAVPITHDIDSIPDPATLLADTVTPPANGIGAQPDSAEASTKASAEASVPIEAISSKPSARPSRPAPRPRPPAVTEEYFLSSSSDGLSGLSETMPVDEKAPTEQAPASSAASPQRALSVNQDRPNQIRAEMRSRKEPAAEAEPKTHAPTAAASAEKRVPTEIPNDTQPQIRAQVIDLEAQGKSLAQLRGEAQARAVSGGLEMGGAKREPEKKPYRPRVSVGEQPEPEPKRRALLSPIVTHLAMGVLSASLMGVIWGVTAPPPAAAPRAVLNITYSSELRPVLEAAETQFEASPEGQGVDVVLVPRDSRSAMKAVLSPAPGAAAADVWIPSETVWSNRFNEVAASFKRRAISAGAGLALSPLVLVARSDRAQPLRAKFPSRLIPSWAALKQAVARDCKLHFGMTDPENSGAGALVRTAMAREWCKANKLPFVRARMNDTKLWSWLDGFESNVPQYKMAGDMVTDLARGTSGQYWWALAYESEAIYWMGQGKPLEVFHLPETFYADHPFCRTERAGTTPAQSAAAARFEKFLRSTPIQQAFLQSGFRAPEIDLSSKVKSNPFQSRDYAARGVRTDGFPVGGRLDYRTVNALVGAWRFNYSS